MKPVPINRFQKKTGLPALAKTKQTEDPPALRRSQRTEKN